MKCNFKFSVYVDPFIVILKYFSRSEFESKFLSLIISLLFSKLPKSCAISWPELFSYDTLCTAF